MHSETPHLGQTTSLPSKCQISASRSVCSTAGGIKNPSRLCPESAKTIAQTYVRSSELCLAQLLPAYLDLIGAFLYGWEGFGDGECVKENTENTIHGRLRLQQE